MKQAIKHEGKRLDNGETVVGWLMPTSDGYYIFLDPPFGPTSDTQCETILEISDCGYFKVDPETVRPYIPELEFILEYGMYSDKNKKYEIHIKGNVYLLVKCDGGSMHYPSLKQAIAFANEHNRKRVLAGLGIKE